ncbi:hypothetical protein ACR820_05030 [Streptomyces netropsis]
MIAVCGAVTVAAVTALLRRAGVRGPIAVAAGLLLALDPFLNRFDSRVMLEAQATTATALGMLLLARTPAIGRGRTATGVGAGLLFAVAVTTLAGYAVYVVTVAACGEWRPWWAQKSDGIARALGLKQISGFNSRDGSVGFTDRLVAQLGQFAVSYVLIVLGCAATLWLVWSGIRRRRHVTGSGPGRTLVIAWASCTLLHLTYTVTLGTVEEQMFYPLLVTSVAALALAAGLLPPPRTRRPAVWAAAAITAAALVLNAVVWARVHTRHDDALRRTLAWTRTHVPSGSVIAATDEGTSFVLPGARLADWHTLSDLRRDRVDYVVVSTELLAQGYARIDRGLSSTVLRKGRLVHSEPGRTTGALRVYDVRSLLAPASTGTESRP